MTDMRKPIFDAVREVRRKGFTSAEVAVLDKALDELAVPRAGTAIAEPAWLREARSLIGQREIPGPQHNNFIAKGWARLGAGWFNDDETPWCGFFVAHCIDKAGHPYPAKGMFARALAWAEWGKACAASVGSIGVFGRDGGGHVGFLVGASSSNYYVLGGNQSNAVNITPIAKSRLVAIRWPIGLPLPTPGLPPMSGGTVTSNEA